MPARQPRTGRQIPEWMILSVVFSFSSILGFPMAARWRVAYPEANKVLLGALGLVFGFVMLVGIWVVFGLLWALGEKVVRMMKRER